MINCLFLFAYHLQLVHELLLLGLELFQGLFTVKVGQFSIEEVGLLEQVHLKELFQLLSPRFHQISLLLRKQHVLICGRFVT